jgi:hypothetical protein
MKHWCDCTIQEKLDRWTNAKRVLVKLPKHEREKHWDMRHWGIQTQCGTVCCAAGHCGLDPWFRQRGFKLKPALFEDVAKATMDRRGIIVTDLNQLGAEHILVGQGGFENYIVPGVPEFSIIHVHAQLMK